MLTFIGDRVEPAAHPSQGAGCRHVGGSGAKRAPCPSRASAAGGSPAIRRQDPRDSLGDHPHLSQRGACSRESGSGDPGFRGRSRHGIGREGCGPVEHRGRFRHGWKPARNGQAPLAAGVWAFGISQRPPCIGGCRGSACGAGLQLRAGGSLRYLQARQLPEEAKNLLRRGQIDAVLFMSVRTADAFCGLVASTGNPEVCRRARSLSLSDKIATRLGQLPWIESLTAASPTREGILRAVDGLEAGHGAEGFRLGPR